MRYFFHIHDVHGLVRDYEGIELPDLAAARIEARLSARDFAIEDFKRGTALNGRWFEIADDQGTVLDIFRIRDVMN